MRKKLILMLTFLISLSAAFPITSSAQPIDQVKSQYMILSDLDTGKILWERRPDEKMYPASTTKIWTCYLVLKNCKDLNEKVKIENIPEIEGSSMYLKNGEEFTVKELLDCLMVRSANDVAYILAKHVGGGNPEKFIDLMNSEAKKAGAQHTHFNNPHGLPDENHYTTARDMLKMTRLAMSNPTFRDIVKQKKVSYKGTKQTEFTRSFDNSNQFLTSDKEMDYDGKKIPIQWELVDGVKTGYTDDAGLCLVSSATKDGHTLLALVFKAPKGSLYHDSRALLDYGFNNYNFISVFKKEDYSKTKKIPWSKERELFYEPVTGFSEIVSKKSAGKASDYTIESKLNNIKLPIKKGDCVGKLLVSLDGKEVKKIDLLAKNDVNSRFDFLTLDYAKKHWKEVLTASVILLLILIFLIYLIIKLFKKIFSSKSDKNKSKLSKRKKKKA